jgi:tRNA (guanine-N7-)-methyltransferase
MLAANCIVSRCAAVRGAPLRRLRSPLRRVPPPPPRRWLSVAASSASPSADDGPRDADVSGRAAGRPDGPRDRASSATAAILRPRVRGKHLDRPWHLTYLRNQGKKGGTPAQRQAMRDLWPTFGVDVATHGTPPRARGGGSGTTARAFAPPPRLDFAGDLFADAPRPDAPVTLEIGFGLGDSLVEAARRSPTRNFLGAEVHRPGVGAALMKLREAGVRNVRVVRMDALWLLRDFVPPNSLSDACVYFPDPWSDAQAHRRIVNPFLLRLLEDAFVDEPVSSSPGGVPRRPRLHVSTDDAAYAAHCVAVMAEAEARSRGRWREVAGWTEEDVLAGAAMPGRSARTKYEARGVSMGHAVFDACYEWGEAREEEDAGAKGERLERGGPTIEERR